MSLAESCGLGDDLFGSFGEDGDRLLAAAVAQVLAGGPMSSTEPELDGNMACQLLGIADSFSSPRMSEFTARLGDSTACLEQLFELRMARARGLLAYDITSVSAYSELEGWGDWGHNRDGEKLRQMNIGLVTDRRAVPVMFGLYPGPIADVSTLRRTVERIAAMGGNASTLVMDRGFGSAANLRYLIDSGTSFVIPGKRQTRCVKALMSELVRLKDSPDRVMIHGDTVYSVLEAEVAVVPREDPSDPEGEETNDTREWELVLSDDPRFAGVPEGMRMKAHACYDAKGAAEERDRMQKALKGIEAKLRAMDPWAALNGVKDVAGGYAKYFDLRVEDGRLVVSRRRNAVSFAMNREGMFVMFSHGVGSWEEMMSDYDCRTYVEQAFDVLKNDLDGNRWRTGDPQTARGRLLIKFVALILWFSLMDSIRDAKDRVPVQTALQALDTIMAVGDGERWRITEVTARSRRLLDAMGVRRPKDVVETKPYRYIPSRYLERPRISGSRQSEDLGRLPSIRRSRGPYTGTIACLQRRSQPCLILSSTHSGTRTSVVSPVSRS